MAAFGLVVAVHMDWVHIDSIGLTVTGMRTEGTNFGQPGMFHLVMAVMYIVFALMPRLWAKRLNLLVGALNLAWAIRNFLLVSACSGGECPEKQAGLVLVMVFSAFLMAGALFPDLDINRVKQRPGA